MNRSVVRRVVLKQLACIWLQMTGERAMKVYRVWKHAEKALMDFLPGGAA
jgi:hypothetical protein